jgi:hypothetical protein
MTSELIDHIIQAATRKDLNAFYFSSRKESVKFSHSLIYKYFTIYIYMQARQDCFLTTQYGCNPFIIALYKPSTTFKPSFLNLLLLTKLYSHFFTRNFFFILNLRLNLAIITKVLSSILATG